MNYFKIYFCFLTFSFLLLSGISRAQQSEGGIPPSFRWAKQPDTRSSGIATHIQTLSFTKHDLLAEDEQQTESGVPLRVATLLPVNLSFEKSATWTVLPSGEKIGRLRIVTPDAIAVMLYYNRFRLPEGSKLFIYSADYSQIIGAYTSSNNPANGRFATEFVAGDDIILEYLAPTTERVTDYPEIEIEEIGYGYNHLSIRRAGELGSSAKCMVDINCEEGINWQNQKRGICKQVMRLGTGSYLCTGSLINNTAQDFKPYILTAHHCMIDGNNNPASDADFSQWIFYFDYEKKSCQDEQISEWKTMTGCELKAISPLDGGSDGMLLLLKNKIPYSYRVYFNGWDRNNDIPQSGVGIHHPQGDIKKISTYTSPANPYTWKTVTSTGAKWAHWNVIYRQTPNGHSITEGGSSGSPLFNQNQLIVGTLTGGNSDCETQIDGMNVYGKLYHHWDKSGNSNSQRMDIYLDPLKTGATTLPGTEPFQTEAVPQNLTVRTENKTAFISWNAPIGDKAPNTYIIYRNDYLVGKTATTSFTETDLTPGQHRYAVSAIYEDGIESLKTNTDTITIYEYRAPQSPVVVRNGEQDIHIRWKAPTHKQQIYWGDHSPSATIGTNGQPTYYFGQRWSASDLREIPGHFVESVTFYPVRGATYSLYIKQGERTYIQAVSSNEREQLYTVALDSAFRIDPTQTLTVAIRVDSYRLAPIMCDNTDCIDGKGNILSYDGKSWFTLYGLNSKQKHNFLVSATISSTSESTSILTTTSGLQSSIPGQAPKISDYHLYRNNERISIPENQTEVFDKGLLPGTYMYHVEVVYENGLIVAGGKTSFRLKDEEFDATIHQLTINGELCTPITEKNEYYYNIPCEINNISLHAVVSEKAKITIDGVLSTDMEITVEPGIRIVKIAVQAEDTDLIEEYLLYIRAATEAECSEAKLYSFHINGNELDLSRLSESGPTVIYVDCGSDQATIEAITSPFASILLPGSENGTKTLFFSSDNDLLEETVTVTSANGYNTAQYPFVFRRLPSTIVLQRWNDVLTVVTNPDNNGGIRFTAYSWYLNGSLIPGENKSYLQISPSSSAQNNVYKVGLKTHYGLEIFSCEKSLQEISKGIKIYPTLVNSHENIHIRFSESEGVSPMMCFIINPSGLILSQTTIRESEATIKSPDTPGSYLLKIVNQAGESTEFKFYVK